MSISKRVTDAFESLVEGDLEGALFQICAAIERTARQEYGRGGQSNYKRFIHDSMPIIAGIGVGTALAGLRIGYKHADLPPSDDRSASLEEIVYHIVRCGLYHEGTLPSDIRLTQNNIGRDDDGNLLINKMLIAGLIVAVIAAPSNGGGSTNPGFFVDISTLRRATLNSLWGKQAELRTALGAVAQTSE